MKTTVVLVEPTYSGNLGSICRAMANFGLKDLRLVTPKADKTSGEAKKYAMHAQDVLEKSKDYKTLKDAVKDCDLIIGTTGIPATGNRSKRIALTPKELKEKLKNKDGRIALVFGREAYGLYDAEVEDCDLLIRIPTSKAYPIMNLSHAIAIVLYELQNETKPLRKLATQEQKKYLASIFAKLVKEYGPANEKSMNDAFKNVINKAGMTKKEADTLTGVFGNTITKRRN
ncbi:MAG: RNA methyltransferase [Candidatus Diapherotrites archaeon]|nr:RNA methyltransferase [Candidatus Diapherotrites archaeon]